ncbi:MAG: CAP domain-containing protein [Breznakia sp.]
MKHTKNKLRICLHSILVMAFVFALVACSSSITLKIEELVVERGFVSVDGKHQLVSDDVKMKDILDTKDEDTLKTAKIVFNKKVKNDATGYLGVGVYEASVQLHKQALDLSVVVKDTIAPKLQEPKSALEYEVGAKDIDLTKQFKATDFSDYKIVVKNQTFKKVIKESIKGSVKKKSAKGKVQYEYTDVAKVDFNKAGTYQVTVVAIDNAKNESMPWACKVVVKEKAQPKATSGQETKYNAKGSVGAYEANTGGNTTGGTGTSGGSTGGEEVSAIADIGTMYALINQARDEHGVQRLRIDPSLEGMAKIRAKEIETLFSHTRPNGESCFSLGMDGENIAFDYRNTVAVFQDFMASPNHQANILKTAFTRVGVAYYQKGQTIFWVQVFSR